jgi:hypothetical protein
MRSFLNQLIHFPSASLLQRPCLYLLLISSLGIVFSSSAFAAAYWVDARFGRDDNPGNLTNKPFKTISRAAEVVLPGDIVNVRFGVYHETVRLHRYGAPDKPIIFRSESRGRNYATITGADPAFRQKQVAWTLVDSSLKLYSAPITWKPSRVLYSGCDLFPYASLADLRSFQIDQSYPGPSHGFYYDSASNLLYVRLHPTGKYGSTNPAGHMMAVGPTSGGGDAGKTIMSPDDFNFGFVYSGDANVILDGFTFETPGVAGVYTRANNVTVQNCWFKGCRTAVSGATESTDDAVSQNNITVQWCDFSHFPAFKDVIETISAGARLSPQPPQFYYWHRKRTDITYELGMILNVGANWKIQGNYINDTFDGISSWGVGVSRNLEISGNVFRNIIDNAVETENHTQNMLIYKNFIIDAFEAISWQPLGGTPWPSSTFVSHNVIYDTADVSWIWSKQSHERAAFKMLVAPDNWNLSWMAGESKTELVVPGSGFVANNNTVIMNNGNIFLFGSDEQLRLRNVSFVNNVLIGRYGLNAKFRGSPTFSIDGIVFRSNYVAPPTPNEPGPAAKIAGPYGLCAIHPNDLKISNAKYFDFTPLGSSPLIDAGVDYSPSYDLSRTIGALLPIDSETLPAVGPQLK